MRCSSLERIYIHLDKHIKLVQSFTEIAELAFIIKACRLKPFDYVFKNKNNKTVLYKWWFDEFGNSLTINKKKNIELIFNDLRLDKNKIISTDLYCGLSINRTIKMSKLAFLIIGKDEDLYQDFISLTLFGIDNYLRSYLYIHNRWQKVSPLVIGVENLKTIASHLDINYYFSASNNKIDSLPCIGEKTWLSCLPANTSLVTEIAKQSEELANLFK